MGSGESSNANANAKASAYTYIETSASSFVPGATVTGNVKILSEKPIQAGQMTILLSCISEVSWTVVEEVYRSRKGNRKFRKFYYRCKKIMFKVEFPIWNFQGQLPQGQFTLPFCIQLPSNLPPSFECFGSDKQSGKNRYIFEAVVEGSTDVQAQKTIVWVSRLPEPNQALVPASVEKSLKVATCCCFKSGRVHLKSEADRNAAMVTDNVVVTSKIDNSNNKHKVKRIVCTLVRIVRLKIHPTIDEPISGQTVFLGTVVSGSQDLDIQPGNSDPLEVAISLDLDTISELWKKPTMKSETIECEYYIKVGLEYDNFCGCESGYRYLRFPVEISNGMVVINTIFSPPPQISVDWNPYTLASAPVAAQGISNYPQDMSNVDHNTTQITAREGGNKIIQE